MTDQQPDARNLWGRFWDAFYFTSMGSWIVLGLLLSAIFGLSCLLYALVTTPEGAPDQIVSMQNGKSLCCSDAHQTVMIPLGAAVVSDHHLAIKTP